MDNIKNLISKIPREVSQVTSRLEKAGFEAYLVGGCVRDLIMGREPKDWDVTTNAKPDQIIPLFDKTIYENKFGTVIVCLPTGKINVSRGTNDLDVLRETKDWFQIEVTPYRIEEKYSDFRHPDYIEFSNKLEDDLKRRDFTMNALAIGHSKGHELFIKDIFDSVKDIKNKLLRTVGNPDDRFKEDALRMMRAVRFACELDFSVSHETSESILKNADLIKYISAERIRDEFSKIIMSAGPSVGIVMLQKLGLLKNIVPELEEGIGCEQSGEHIYNVWEHLLYALQHAADKVWPLEVRLAALFHDIGKPRTRRLAELAPQSRTLGIQEGSTFFGQKKYTFYGHEVVGARMAKKIMERLKFTKRETELVEKLVRNHMFFSDPEKITLSAVRRIITRVGPADTFPPHKAKDPHSKVLADKSENHPIWDLMKVRECDRVGMRKKETPYRLRKYFAMIEEALRDPISVGQLKIDGNVLMSELGIKPGPRMGWILNSLLEEVLDDPTKNTLEHLSELVKSLDMLPDKALKALGERGKEKKEELEEREISKLHQKHGVGR